MDAKELLAREHIRDLIARYCFFMDQGRIDELLALFAADGEFEIYGRSASGATAIRELFAASGAAARTLGRRLRPQHLASVSMIDLEGAGAASAETYFTVITNEGLDHWGIYRDQLTAAGDHWLLRRRVIQVLGSTAGGLGEHLARHMAPAK